MARTCTAAVIVAAVTVLGVPCGAPVRADERVTAAPQTRRVAAGLVPQTHRFDVAEQRETPVHRGSDLGEVVYSNTPPPDAYLYGLPAGTVVADDLTTVAVNGCAITAYEFQVHGGGDGSGPGFTVTFDLYDECPDGDGAIIPGTGGSITLDNDGLHSVLVDFAPAPVTVGQKLWLGVSIDGEDAGWLIGTPARVGYTHNAYSHPYDPCAARFANSTLYAGFSATLYAQPPFDREFIAYANTDLNGMPFAIGPDQWLMDDVELIVDDCVLTSFEVGAVGTGGGGQINMTAELRTACEPPFAIEGTQATASFDPNGSPTRVRFDFPGGVDLGDSPSLWMAFQFSRSAYAIHSGRAEMGYTDDVFARLEGATQECHLYWVGSDPRLAGFAIRIHCLGDPPIGACCGHNPGDTCREVPPAYCIGPGDEWLLGTACDPEPFDPPCGAFACCLPDPAPYGSCENLSPDECIARGGVPEGDVLCGDHGQACDWWVCRTAETDCCIAADTLGCAWRDCCNEICDADPWCCEVGWDDVCVERARLACWATCPHPGFEWLEPAPGTIDARQPHPLNSTAAPEGIDSITVAAPEHAGGCCWHVCEDGTGYPPNRIRDVTGNGDGTYTVRLDRPITAGEWTTLSYGYRYFLTASFGSLPGDANGNRRVDPSDIIAIIDQINGVAEPPFGTYSCDIDRNGECAASDIVRLIDLINGAADFSPWISETLPETGPACEPW